MKTKVTLIVIGVLLSLVIYWSIIADLKSGFYDIKIESVGFEKVGVENKQDIFVSRYHFQWCRVQASNLALPEMVLGKYCNCI